MPKIWQKTKKNLVQLALKNLFLHGTSKTQVSGTRFVTNCEAYDEQANFEVGRKIRCPLTFVGLSIFCRAGSGHYFSGPGQIWASSYLALVRFS